MKNNHSHRGSRQGKHFAAISAFCLLFSVLLCGCVSTSSVKKFNENREKFLTNEFDVSTLPGGVRTPIERAFVDGRKFNKVVMQFDVTETNNGVVKYLALSETLYGRDHGLTLYQDEWADNDIPYRVNNGSSLLGMVALDIGSVFLSQANYVRSPQDSVIKKINSIDPSPVQIKEDSSLTIKYEIGTRAQIVNLHPCEWKFTFGQRFPASQINPALQGDALDCEAVSSNDAGAVAVRTKYTYLLNYGFAITGKFSNSSVNDTYSLKTVRFE
jgi:hypothetical protein